MRSDVIVAESVLEAASVVSEPTLGINWNKHDV